jgi:hypothetical protein
MKVKNIAPFLSEKDPDFVQKDFFIKTSKINLRSFGKNPFLCARFPKAWSLGRVVRHSSAKAATAVRVRQRPQVEFKPL